MGGRFPLTTTGEGEGRLPRLTARDKLVFAGKILVSVALLGLCIHYVDFGSTLAALSKIAWPPLILAFIFATVGTVVLPAFMTHSAMRVTGMRKSMAELIALNFSVRFYVIVLPRIASIWIRWRRYGDGVLKGDTFALIAFERAVQMLTLCSLSAVALVLEQDRLGHAGWLTLQASLVATVISVGILAAFLFRPAAILLTSVTVRLEPFLPTPISRRLTSLVEAVAAYRHMSPGRTGLIFWWSLVGFALFIMSSYVVAIALGLKISILALTWVRSFVFLMTLMPLSIAGIGLREVGFVGLLSLYGMAAEDALAFSLANFALQLGMAVIGALFELRLLFLHDKAASRASPAEVKA